MSLVMWRTPFLGIMRSTLTVLPRHSPAGPSSRTTACSVASRPPLHSPGAYIYIYIYIYIYNMYNIFNVYTRFFPRTTARSVARWPLHSAGHIIYIQFNMYTTCLILIQCIFSRITSRGRPPLHSLACMYIMGRRPLQYNMRIL